jgi:hypothetical protein
MGAVSPAMPPSLARLLDSTKTTPQHFGGFPFCSTSTVESFAVVKPPQLSSKTISALQRVITGNPIHADLGGDPVAPYRSGPDLITFFSAFGFTDIYADGFPSRWFYVEEKLKSLNGSQRLITVIEGAVSPVHFLGTKFDWVAAVSYLNQYLSFDGYKLVPAGKTYRLRREGETGVEADSRLEGRDKASHEFIDEQLTKCDQKLQTGDYDGAITNARSLLEAVLFEIEGRIDPNRPTYDGDLLKLYKRVQQLLHLDPSRTDISDSLKQLLSGLVSVVTGLAPLRNKMGDAHVRTYKPDRRHAKLAVNAAKTITDFLIDSFEYQKTTGKSRSNSRKETRNRLNGTQIDGIAPGSFAAIPQPRLTDPHHHIESLRLAVQKE